MSRPPAPPLLLVALAVLAGCATPLRPSGGPEDQMPPALLASVPEAGAVRVADRRVVLTFSERVDEASLRRALVVAPEPARAPEVRVRGREAEITLPDSLRPDVTYVLTIGTELRDLRNVALAAPLTLAFATGDRIDRGALAGIVRDPATGRGAAGLAVFAYRLPADSVAATALPDPRTAPPDYRSQTGADGAFTLTYLRPGPYFVAAVADRNRNGRADAGEAVAVPPSPVLRADTTGAIRPPADSARVPPPLPSRSPTAAFVLALADTTGPALRGARARSPRVVALRFDEGVRLDGDGPPVVVEDSASGRAVAVAAGWIRPEDAREVLAAVAEPLAPARYRVRLARPGAVRDSAGTAAAPFSTTFEAPAVPDTARAQFVGFLPDARVAADSAFVLRPDERAGVRFSLPLDTAAAHARIAVRGGDGPVAFRLVPADAVSYRIETGAAAFAVVVGDSARVRRYEAPGAAAFGGIVGRVEGGPALVEAFPEGARVAGRTFRARTGADGAFALTGLPPGAYRLRVVIDRDGDGAWDAGALAPFSPPEPLGWLAAPVRVRARWDTDAGAVRLSGGEATADGLEPPPDR